MWGLALHESFNTVVGQVAQLKRTANGLKLEKVICAVDCGLAVNPNIVAMQMESGIGYGLAAALTGAITLKDGKVEQGNFDDYSGAAHEPDAGHRRAHRAVDQQAHRRRRAGYAGHRAGAGECAGAANGKPVRSLPLSAQGITLV